MHPPPAPRVLCLALVFFDLEVVRRSLAFLGRLGAQVDLVVLENRSPHSDSSIRPYLNRLLADGGCSKVVEFDDNASNNAVEFVLSEPGVFGLSLQAYDWILVTDGDIEMAGIDWLSAECDLLERRRDLFACCVQLDLVNLPVVTFPDAAGWIPPIIQAHPDFIETKTGIHLALFRAKELVEAVAWLQRRGLRFVDSALHHYCYQVLGRKWGVLPNHAARHLTWDSYSDPAHPYTVWKRTQTLASVWNHARFGGGEVRDDEGVRRFHPWRIQFRRRWRRAQGVCQRVWERCRRMCGAHV